MDFPLKFLILCLLQFLQSTNTFNTTNYHNLVYNKCSNQTFNNNLNHSSLLPTLFQQFSIQSTQSKFFTTIVGDENAAITGTFQCRKDLSPEECKKCVSKFSNVSQELCGETLPARIQLSGCYAHYRKDWAFTQPDTEHNYVPDQVLHKKCSKLKVKGNEFEEITNAALSELAVGVMNGEGFCERTYETAYVMAQCEGNLGVCDCAECVSSAVQIVEEECRHSVSGEVYMDRCFISYKYYVHDQGEYEDDDENGNRSPKLVAIVVGGLAALFLGFGLCCLLRSCGKKKDDW